ncbi:MAG: S8 family serine peptidase [Bdellovibrionaceae bacterium]|nr:S8 family serine peptidase [Pseudobdellovibrionaceae bacterium]
MNFSEVWARGFRGQGQKIGFADTGLDKGDVNDLHMDLSGRATGEAFGWFASSGEDPVGHGTHVAGSIAGSGAASGGRIIGAAPEATLMAQGMWSPFIGNLTVPPKFAAMLEPAYNEGVRVHSNSWGSPQNLGAYEAMAAQADEFMFDHPDLLLVFSAGNNGVDADKDGRIDGVTIGSPGTAKNVLTVGSSENVVSSGGIQAKIGQLAAAQKLWPKEPIFSDGLSDNANGIAAFSSRGPTQDGRVKPDLVAPGTNILSLRSHHPDSEDMWGAYNQDYVFSGGTSMSTPLVAGAAALVRQYLTQVRGLWNPSAALIKNILMHTAVDLFPGQFGHVGQSAGQELLTRRPNVDEGWGRVDVARAIRLERTILIDESIGVESGGEMKYLLRPPTDGQATLSLVWTDAPGSPAAAQALVNDLDLVLVDPMGQEFTPADRLNNSEVIEKAVRAGDYTVVVRGHNVPQGRDGKQPFALVMTIH